MSSEELDLHGAAAGTREQPEAVAWWKPRATAALYLVFGLVMGGLGLLGAVYVHFGDLTLLGFYWMVFMGVVVALCALYGIVVGHMPGEGRRRAGQPKAGGAGR